MSPTRHPDWTATIRAHWQRTTGFLLANREPCITIRNAELAAITGRALVGRDTHDLTRWTPPASWILGVLLCPGDTIDPIVDWFRPLKADPTRIWVYLHPDVHHRVLQPWEDAGYETDQVDVVSTWQELHKRFALALNDRVYGDLKGEQSPPE